jgi:hypothetical protein
VAQLFPKVGAWVATNRVLQHISQRIKPGAAFGDPIPEDTIGKIVGEVNYYLYKVDFGAHGTKIVDVRDVDVITREQARIRRLERANAEQRLVEEVIDRCLPSKAVNDAS